jgi:hypothetical protein
MEKSAETEMAKIILMATECLNYLGPVLMRQKRKVQIKSGLKM